VVMTICVVMEPKEQSFQGHPDQLTTNDGFEFKITLCLVWTMAHSVSTGANITASANNSLCKASTNSTLLVSNLVSPCLFHVLAADTKLGILVSVRVTTSGTNC